MKKILFVWLGLLCFCTLRAQTQTKWFDPQHQLNVVGGQAWKADTRYNMYDRLPVKAEKSVRADVWNLSRNSAGLYLRFYTDSPTITVRYGVEGSFSMPHMPATGVSGVDLYAVNRHGKQMWCGGDYRFSDTVVYTYGSLYYDAPGGYEYTLWLPLYNTVKWLEVGVDETSSFAFIPATRERPVVVYGTSIAQGACASRPGMAWTSILGRRLGGELVNMGFSGNGRLEDGVIDLLAEVDAKAYVFDCMPNLVGIETSVLRDSIVKAVQRIKRARPEVPLILSEHAGYPNGTTNSRQRDRYMNCNEATRKAFEKLIRGGMTGIYLLTFDEIAQPLDATVEGVHPNDYGMAALADAYEKKLREVLDEPLGTLSTQIPVIQRREPQIYEWRERHEQILELCAGNPPKVVLMGNSLTHHWGGLPACRVVRDSVSWNSELAPLGAVNMGFGWDKIENLLWRVYHGELDGYRAEQVIVMIGTNNLNGVPDAEITDGIRFLMQAIRKRQPQARIKLVGIPPRRGEESHLKQVNAKLSEIAAEQQIEYLDLSPLLTGSDGKIDKSLYLKDGLHLNAAGYGKIARTYVR